MSNKGFYLSYSHSEREQTMILGIYGTSGVGREVLDMALQINRNEKRWTEIIFINDYRYGETVHDIEVHPFSYILGKYTPDSIEISIAMGEPELRKLVAERVEAAGYSLVSIIHPNAYLGIGAIYGPGLILREGAIISCGAVVGKNVCFQSYAILGHDGIMGDHCEISSFAAIGGNCILGNQVFIGMNSGIKEKLLIGNDVIIAMGSMVFRDIPEGMMASGNPARVFQRNMEKRVFSNE